MKKVYVFAALLLMAGMAMGQNNEMTAYGNVQYNPYVSNNISDCLSASDCWQKTTQTGIKVAASFGHVDVIDGNGLDHSFDGVFDHTKTTWTAHPEYGNIYMVHWAADGNLYGLISCGSTQCMLGRWNGSSWTNINCCFVNFSTSPQDALMVANDPNGTIWVSTNYGVSFTSKPWCNATGEAAVSVDSSGNANFYVTCSGNLWKYGDNNWTQVPGLARSIAYGGLDIEGNPMFYLIDEPPNNGFVSHFNNTASGYDKLNFTTNSQTSSIAVGDPYNIWTVDSNGNVWRFSQYGLTVSATYAGAINACPPLMRAVCAQASHHLEFNMTVNNQTVSTTQDWNDVGSGWNKTLSVPIHNAFIGNCFTGNSPNCNPTHSAKVLCSLLGPLAPLAVDEATADTYTLKESVEDSQWASFLSYGGPYQHGTNYGGYWDGLVQTMQTPACPAGTTATCHHDYSVPIRFYTQEPYEDPSGLGIESAIAEGKVSVDMEDRITGADSPYVYRWTYMQKQGSPPVCVSVGQGTRTYGGAKGPLPPCS